jgi:putative transposase
MARRTRCDDAIVSRADPRSIVVMPDSWRPPARNRRLPMAAYRDPDRPCFVTIRAARNTAPFRDARLSAAVVDALHGERQRAGCDLYVYCLMPDHLHALTAARPDGGCVLRYMQAFKGRSTHLAWELGYQGQLWQPRFYDHVLRAAESLPAIYWYVVTNPVRAGLVTDPDRYPWIGEPDPCPW